MDFNLKLLYSIMFMTGMSYWSLKCGMVNVIHMCVVCVCSVGQVTF